MTSVSEPFFISSKLKSKVLSWKDGKLALTILRICQGELINSSRSFHQNIKRFFKKLFIFLKKSCQVFIALFSPIGRNILRHILNFDQQKRHFSSKRRIFSKKRQKTFAGSKLLSTFFEWLLSTRKNQKNFDFF